MSEQQTQREQFLRAIAATRKMVAKWPAWKRNALGPVPAAPDFPTVATPEAAKRVEAGRTGKDTPKEPDAPYGQKMARVDLTDLETGLLMAPAIKGVIDDLRARVAALTKERDEARNQLRCMAVLARDMIRRVKEVCGE